MAANKPATTGIAELDRLVGGLQHGDNVVLEMDSGAPVERFVSSFVAAAREAGRPIVYISFNRSPQTIVSRYERYMAGGNFTLIDCFTSGKGQGDGAFLDFFQTEHPCRVIRIEQPNDPSRIHEALVEVGGDISAKTHYVFDSITGMYDLWNDNDAVMRFFGHICPRLYDMDTVAYWTLERAAHDEQFLAKIRHVTQIVMDIAMVNGQQTVTVRKAAGRASAEVGIPQRFEVVEDRLVIAAESREGRELALLNRMGEALESALDQASFFERTMNVLAEDLGMLRATLVLLDRVKNRLGIVAAHGLSPAERSKGFYAVGEGITGRVVETGRPEIVPDISKDPRFLDRTTSRRRDTAQPIAFICVPIRIDGDVGGALSVDRAFAVAATVEKDLRLLKIVASLIAQVIKINNMVNIEKSALIARDSVMLEDLRSRYRMDNVVGTSEAMRKVLAVAATAARSRASILITGETGTGKELIANVIHYNSMRAGGPFIKLNCGALPETLLESELFGHVKGAFTGAVENRKGRFERADGGTLFLDEVAEMSPRLQVKLLRALQEREFEAVGGAKTVRVDVRVLAATNKDLVVEIEEGRFREDLYYRLNVIPVHLPPLRERREDIPPLVEHFLEKFNRENDRKITKLSKGVLDLLLEYPWFGNVRELENSIERAVVMSPGEVLSAEALPQEIAGATRKRPRRGEQGSALEKAVRQSVGDYLESGGGTMAGLREKLLRLVEETVIRRAAGEEGANQRDLAEMLGMSRMTLRKKMREYGMK